MICDRDTRAALLALIDTGHQMTAALDVLTRTVAGLAGIDPQGEAVTEALWNERDRMLALDIVLHARAGAEVAGDEQ